MIANSRREPYGHRRYLIGRRGEPNQSASPVFLLGKSGGVVMKQWRGILQRLRTQQPNQIHLFIIIPSLTLFFLSLIDRTASSASDPALEKKKVAEQLKQRLSEVQNDKDSTIALTAERSTLPAHQQTPHHIQEKGAPKWTLEGCPASPGSPNQCIVSERECQTGASDSIFGDELGKTPDEILQL